MHQAPEIPEKLFEQYFASLILENRENCIALIDQWLQCDPSLQRLYEELFQRSLYQIGALWEQGILTVTGEHHATALTESLMVHVYLRTIPSEPKNHCALAACTPGESHRIGCRMVADFFELHHWQCQFLGGNATVKQIKQVITDQHIGLLALSVTLPEHLKQLYKTVQSIRLSFPELPILVGGQGFRNADLTPFRSLTDVHYLKSLKSLELWLQNYSPSIGPLTSRKAMEEASLYN